MSEAEKQELIRVLQQVKSILEPSATRKIAEIRYTHSEMMKSISQITFLDLRADLTAQAMKLLGYTTEHQAPIDALDKAIAYAEQTDSATLTKERVKEIGEESGWLELKNL